MLCYNSSLSCGRAKCFSLIEEGGMNGRKEVKGGRMGEMKEGRKKEREKLKLFTSSHITQN